VRSARLLCGCLLIGGASVPLRAQQSPVEVVTLTTPAEATTFVLAKTGRLAGAVCRDKKLRLWSLPDGALLRTVDLGDRRIDAVVISADGASLAAGDHAGGYTVWDTATGAERMALTMPFYPSALAFSPDGRQLAIAPVGEPVQLYDVASRTKVVELQRPVGGTSALAFSRDGSRIATADADTAIRVYDARSGKMAPPNTDFLLEPLALAFTADGKQLVTGGDKVMASVDVASGRMIRKSGKLEDPVAALDISPDGTLVAAMLLHADNMLLPGLVIVSETASGQKVTQWLPATAPLGGGWTNDGRLLIATGSEKALHIWRVR
jgi:WD40 repeat protein